MAVEERHFECWHPATQQVVLQLDNIFFNSMGKRSFNLDVSKFTLIEICAVNIKLNKDLLSQICYVLFKQPGRIISTKNIC